MSDLTFYDLSSKLVPEAWSPNTTKVRGLLNYLGIKYDTKFLRYPEIASTLKGLGVKSWAEQKVFMHCHYSVPAVTFRQTGTTVMGGEYFIPDALAERYDVGEKIYGATEETKLLGKQIDLSILEILGKVLAVAGPFTYNIIEEDDDARQFYRLTRMEKGLGDVRELVKQPKEHFDLINKDITETLNSLESRHDLKKFFSGEYKFLTGDRPIYADFNLFGTIFWHKLAQKGGAPALEVFNDTNSIWYAWYQRLSQYA